MCGNLTHLFLLFLFMILGMLNMKLSFDEVNNELYFGDFNFVRTFHIEHDTTMNCYNLQLILTKDSEEAIFEYLELNFYYISDMHLLNIFKYNIQQFMGLVLEKCSNQWENVKYQLRQIEDDEIHLKCKDFSACLVQN